MIFGVSSKTDNTNNIDSQSDPKVKTGFLKRIFEGSRHKTQNIGVHKFAQAPLPQRVLCAAASIAPATALAPIAGAMIGAGHRHEEFSNYGHQNPFDTAFAAFLSGLIATFASPLQIGIHHHLKSGFKKENIRITNQAMTKIKLMQNNMTDGQDNQLKNLLDRMLKASNLHFTLRGETQKYVPEHHPYRRKLYKPKQDANIPYVKEYSDGSISDVMKDIFILDEMDDKPTPAQIDRFLNDLDKVITSLEKGNDRTAIKIQSFGTKMSHFSPIINPENISRINQKVKSNAKKLFNTKFTYGKHLFSHTDQSAPPSNVVELPGEQPQRA